MTVIGEAQIVIRAVDTGFEKELQSKVNAAAKGTQASVAVKADTKDLEKGLSSAAKTNVKNLEKDVSGVGASLKTTGGHAATAAGGLKELEGKAAGAGGSIKNVLTNGLSAAKSKLEEFASQGGAASKALQGIVSGGAGAVGPLAGVAVGIGALTAITAAGVGHFIELTGQIRAFKNITGASSEDASRFVVALNELGINSDAVAKGLFKMSREIEGGKGKLAEFGIETVRTKGGQVDLIATFRNVADAIQRVGPGADANTIAFGAFGKAGQQLLPILLKNRQAFDEFLQTAERRHELFSDADLEKGRQFKVALNSLKGSAEALEITFGQAVLPTLTKLAGGLTTVIDKSNDLIRSLGGGGLTDVLGGVLDAVAPGTNLLLAFGDSHKAAADKAAELDQKLQDETAALEASTQAAQEEYDALQAVASAQTELINQSLGAEGAQRNFASAQKEVTEKTTALNVAIRDHGAASTEAKTAADALSDSQFALKESAVNLAQKLADQVVAQDAANGKVDDAVTKEAILKQKLLEVAGTLQPGSALRGALEGYASQLKDVQGDKKTQLVLDTQRAVAALNAYQTQFLGFLQRIAQAQHLDPATINIAAIPKGPGRAAGGPIDKNRIYTVNEDTPNSELFVSGTSGAIVTQTQLLDALRNIFNVKPTTSAGVNQVNHIQLFEVAQDMQATARAVGVALAREAKR